jgi:hypothetical protein
LLRELRVFLFFWKKKQKNHANRQTAILCAQDRLVAQPIESFGKFQNKTNGRPQKKTTKLFIFEIVDDIIFLLGSFLTAFQE